MVGSGSANGQHWSARAAEGPWGTCFTAGSGTLEFFCVPVARLNTTAVLGGWDSNPSGSAFGSAAPGVASVRVRLSNGKTVRVTPVPLGNERLFAFAIASGVSPGRWTAYSASGREIGSGTTPATG